MIKAGRSLLLMAVLLPVLFLAACASRHGRLELVARWDASDRPVLIDVRTKGEYERGHLPGAIHIGVSSLPFRMDELGDDKEKPVLVYCAHGPRAGLAGFFLRAAGFKQVYHLEGHWAGWQKAGMPVQRGAGKKGEGDGGPPP